jgi:hypothetical protein
MIVFRIRLTPMPGVNDPVRALRAALKSLRRRHGLRALSAVQEIPAQQESSRPRPTINQENYNA